MSARTMVARLAPQTLQQRAERTDAIAVGLTAFAFLYGILVGHVTGISAGLDVRPHLHGTPAEAGSLLARNGALCLLLIAAAHLTRVWRPIASVAQMLAGAIPLGTALIGGLIAAHAGGLRYLPHAPFELLAAALAGAWPLRALSVPATRTSTMRRAAIVVGLLVIAAALETFATPHIAGAR